MNYTIDNDGLYSVRNKFQSLRSLGFPQSAAKQADAARALIQSIDDDKYVIAVWFGRCGGADKTLADVLADLANINK